jgi:hypothetical protein
MRRRVRTASSRFTQNAAAGGNVIAAIVAAMKPGGSAILRQATPTKQTHDQLKITLQDQ